MATFDLSSKFPRYSRSASHMVPGAVVPLTTWLLDVDFTSTSFLQVPIARIAAMCSLLEVALTQPGGPELTGEVQRLQPILAMTFVFCLLWGVAGNVTGDKANEVDGIIRNVFDECSEARVSVLLPFIQLFTSLKTDSQQSGLEAPCSRFERASWYSPPRFSVRVSSSS